MWHLSIAIICYCTWDQLFCHTQVIILMPITWHAALCVPQKALNGYQNLIFLPSLRVWSGSDTKVCIQRHVSVQSNVVQVDMQSYFVLVCICRWHYLEMFLRCQNWHYNIIWTIFTLSGIRRQVRTLSGALFLEMCWLSSYTKEIHFLNVSDSTCLELKLFNFHWYTVILLNISVM